MAIINENGIDYQVDGDYPNGKYVKQILNKGTPIDYEAKFQAALANVDIPALKSTNMGWAVIALYYAVRAIDED